MRRNRHALLLGSAGLLAVTAGAALPLAQQDPPNPIAATSPSTSNPPEQPLVVVTENHRRLRVVPLARGLSHPWGMALLPDGRTILVTERPGRLRVVRDGVLEKTPVAGVPTLNPLFIGGLMDVALHPAFASNQLVYLSYSKDGDRGVTLALARGRFDGQALTDVRDIFVAEAWEAGGGATGGGGTFGGRILFGRDGLLYLTVGDRDVRVLTDDPLVRSRAQSLRSHTGKVLRLRDDGSVPKDNPFVGRKDALPEIFTYGHRNAYGLAFHPQTGALWECEFGPMSSRRQRPRALRTGSGSIITATRTPTSTASRTGSSTARCGTATPGKKSRRKAGRRRTTSTPSTTASSRAAC